MHLVDVLIVVCIAAGAWSGYRSGAIRQVLRIGGTVISYWVAIRYPSILEPLVLKIDDQWGGKIIAGFGTWAVQGVSILLTFALCHLLVSLLTFVIQGIFDLPVLSFVNRMAGTVLGTCIAFLLIAIVVQVSNYVQIPTLNKAIAQSNIAQSFSHILLSGLPSIHGPIQGIPSRSNPFHISY
ncbi:CvpA family protein [Fodinisporobacter ferrooxydans]|uniref:CvpA family protein n=1 Tax=Fodinisporobacter ferrooxydans TaxID=2901836 RepID=A0ABY4CQC5_9BACL|nr:CvpA family protein [Alicyclobacillaceae bacterium MYW30-H2]